jgi:hypothetical protein
MMMITTRISKLEGRLAARCLEQRRSIADEIREARRRRYQAEGREFEEWRPEIPFVAADGRPLRSAKSYGAPGLRAAGRNRK